jgi:probable rRNA maturation factor
MARRAHIIIEHPEWKRRWALLNRIIRDACRATLDYEHIHLAELTVVLTTDVRLRNLNHNFRGKDNATNVLSFPSGEPIGIGEIALSMDTLTREAEEQGKRVDDHLTHLIVHSLLHLLGHDHMEEVDAKVMERKEIKILQSLGVPNPY